MSFVRQAPLDETNFPLFAEMKNALGFIPNFYRAQTMRPDLIEPQAQLFHAVLMKEGALTRQQKEYIFLVCSAANLSTYCVTVHCEMIRLLGISGPEPEQVAVDHTAASLPLTMKALLNFAAKLNDTPAEISAADVDALRTYGYDDEHILEAVLMVGLAKFSNFVSVGLGAVPDFDASKVRLPEKAAAGAANSIL